MAPPCGVLTCGRMVAALLLSLVLAEGTEDGPAPAAAPVSAPASDTAGSKPTNWRCRQSPDESVQTLVRQLAILEGAKALGGTAQVDSAGPGAPLANVAPAAPAAPAAPNADAAPAMPASPAAPIISSAPAAPAVPNAPAAPNAPNAFAAPSMPASPAAPIVPSAPIISSAPAAPAVPNAPAVPAALPTPNAPSAPAAPLVAPAPLEAFAGGSAHLGLEARAGDPPAKIDGLRAFESSFASDSNRQPVGGPLTLAQAQMSQGPWTPAPWQGNASAMLQSIVRELHAIQMERNAALGASREGLPCSVEGSWQAEAAGVRLDVAAAQGAALAVALGAALPPTQRPAPLLDLRWRLRGAAPFPRSGLFSLSGHHPPSRRLLSFVGQCRVCGGADTVTGVWTVARQPRDCRDTHLFALQQHDVFRRDSLHLLRLARDRAAARARPAPAPPPSPTPPTPPPCAFGNASAPLRP